MSASNLHEYDGYGYAVPVTSTAGSREYFLDALNQVFDGYYADFDQFVEEANFCDFWEDYELEHASFHGALPMDTSMGILVCIGDTFEEAGNADIVERLLEELHEEPSDWRGDVEILYYNNSEF